MSKLSVQTRGDSTPQGKPRVYFCCHPGDFARCFPSICQDLLELENCAVYYETDWSTPISPEELEEMRLFVVPLTANCLTKPCLGQNGGIRLCPGAPHSGAPPSPWSPAWMDCFSRS